TPSTPVCRCEILRARSLKPVPQCCRGVDKASRPEVPRDLAPEGERMVNRRRKLLSATGLAVRGRKRPCSPTQRPPRLLKNCVTPYFGFLGLRLLTSAARRVRLGVRRWTSV